MLGELDIAIFLKTNDDLEQVARRVFTALGTAVEPGDNDDWEFDSYVGAGLGFTAVLYGNTGDMEDPEFSEYAFTLEIASQFWCPELDTVELEEPLSEYYARMLAFTLDLETAVAIAIDETDDAEIFEVRAFARNTQYRLDSGPTVARAIQVGTRRFEAPLDEGEDDQDEWEEVDEGDEDGDDEV
jgi:hypothetical protein